MSRWGDLIPHEDRDDCLCGCQDETDTTDQAEPKEEG